MAENTTALLFQHACAHRFEEFDRLFSEMEGALPFADFWEAYLLRAQIKLYVSDATLLHDLELAERAGKAPVFPALSNYWSVDAPNRFIIFPQNSGGLSTFFQALPKAGESLCRWYGARGSMTVRQVEGEISYFTGNIKAAACAELPRQEEPANHTDSILSLILHYRCCLASGKTQDAANCMLEIVRYAKSYPECLAVYASFRGWANATTGWSGDTLRFSEDTAGKKQPVFDDRLDYIKMGSARTTPLESPFAAYAQRHYAAPYSLREYYMNLFHAMYWLAEDQKQTEQYFLGLYTVARASGVVMPIIECGEQVVPLLRFVKGSGMEYDREWIDDMILRAVQYEACLQLYRSSEE